MSHAQQYHFEIAIVDEDDVIDDIVSSPNIYDLRREIEHRVFPHSKYYSPLQSIGWYLCFAASKQKLIPLKTNDDIKNAVYEHRDKRNFKLLVKLKDEEKYKKWKDQQRQLNLSKDRQYTVSTPTIKHIEAFSGYFKCTVEYPPEIVNKIPYRIEYQTRRESRRKKEKHPAPPPRHGHGDSKNSTKSDAKHHGNDHLPSSTPKGGGSGITDNRSKSNMSSKYEVDSSPFIVRHHIWPNEKYRIRVRLVSKLFPKQRSGWTKWSGAHQVLPPSVHSLIARQEVEDAATSSPRFTGNGKSNSRGFKSALNADEFEIFDTKQLSEWMQSKRAAIPLTPFEDKSVFPTVMDVVQRCKVNGEQFLYQRPEEYVADLMAIYDESKAKNDALFSFVHFHYTDLLQKQQKLHFQCCTDSMYRSTNTKSPRDLDRKLDAKLTKILNLMQQSTIKSKLPQNGNGTVSAETLGDEDFVRLLEDPEVERLLSENGFNAVDIGKQIEDKISRRRHGKKGAAFTKHDFLSILYRLKQRAFSDLAFPICASPYCIYLWCFFIKEPRQKYTVKPARTVTQSHMLQQQDFHEMALIPALSVGECCLYFGVYHVRTLAVWTDLEFNLYENGQIAIIEGEQVVFQSQNAVHMVMRCQNTDKKGDRDDKIEKIKMLAEWSNVYVKKNILRSTINLPFFDCLMKFVFRFVGQSVPFSDCVEILEILHKAHDQKKYGDDLYRMMVDHLMQYKCKNTMFKLDHEWRAMDKMNDHEKWSNLTAVLFRLYWIMGTDMTTTSDLFDSRQPLNLDIIQQIVSGFYGPSMKRCAALLRSIFNVTNPELLDLTVGRIYDASHGFDSRIIASIQSQRSYDNVTRQHQFILWHHLLNCMIMKGKAQKFPLQTQLKAPQSFHDAEASKFEVNSLFLRLIQLDVALEKLTQSNGALINRDDKMEKQGFEILTICLMLSKRAEGHRAKIEECFRKMICILSVFQPSYSEVMEENQVKVEEILAHQRYPLRAVLEMYLQLRPDASEQGSIEVFAEYMARYVDAWTPTKGSGDETIRKVHRLLEKDPVMKKNTILLNAILNNDSLCWRPRFLPHIVPLLSSNGDYKAMDKKLVSRRLKKLYDLYWEHKGLLQTMDDLVKGKGLALPPLVEVLKSNTGILNAELVFLGGRHCSDLRLF